MAHSLRRRARNAALRLNRERLVASAKYRSGLWVGFLKRRLTGG